MAINNLLNKQLDSVDGKAKLDYKDYWNAVEIICNDIKSKYDYVNEKIGIIGMARGALPLLVSVSHMLGIREISTIQFQMSNSDNMHDYGEVRIINEMISNNYDKFILLEDIVYKGKTTNAAVDLLKKRNKNVICVYSLVVDEGFKEIGLNNKKIDVNFVYELKSNEWAIFLWEENILKDDE